MARYIDLEILERRIKKYVKPEIPEEKAFVEWCKDECIRQAYAMPTADVVPKSEVEKLTINMNAYGLTAKRLAEENESLEIELENMRRNLGDAREGWNDAECEVERLRKALDEYEETSGLKQAKAEVAKKIFEEIDTIFSEHYGKASEKTDSKLLEPLRQAQRFVINEIYDDLAELKKKYTQN